MTKTQKKQFNRMRLALKRIVAYQKPSQLRRTSEKSYGLDYIDSIEYAYENIQEEARVAIRGVKAMEERKQLNQPLHRTGR